MTVRELRAGEKVRDTVGQQTDRQTTRLEYLHTLRRPREGLEPTYPTRAPATLPASQPEQQSMAIGQ